MLRKKKCKKCGKEARKRYKNNTICFQCNRKEQTIIPIIKTKCTSLEMAEKKIRTIHMASSKEKMKKGYAPSFVVSLPSCYMGHKVRVIAVKEDKKE